MEEIAKEILGRGRQCGIVYCFSQRECEEMHTFLRERGVKSAFYHAGLDDEVCATLQYYVVWYHIGLRMNQRVRKPHLFVKRLQKRRSVQRAWQNNKKQVICATIAFGMGIDKVCVRLSVWGILPSEIGGASLWYWPYVASRTLPSDTSLVARLAGRVPPAIPFSKRCFSPASLLAGRPVRDSLHAAQIR